ncbi:MAG: hypothetical protein AAF436_17040 [Myxococcota bacterium]
MARTSWIYVSVAILMGTAWVDTVEAQTPKVVVLGFSGSGGNAARTQVVRALRGRADFAPRAEADAKVVELGLDPDSAAGRAAVSEALGVDYTFFGRVKGRGSNARTEIRVAGADGRTLTGYEAGAPGTSKGNGLIQEATRTALAEAMQISPPQKRKAAPVAVTATAATATATATATALPPAATTESRKERKAREAQEAEAKKKAEAKRKAEEKKKADGKKMNGVDLPVFEIAVGGGARFRNIDFNVGNNTGGTEERTFDSGAYADVGGYFVVRPLARSENPALQAIIIQGDGGVGFGLEAAPRGTATAANIQTWRALGQVGYLFPIKRLQVGGLVGVGVDTFDIDLNFILPSIQYVYFRVGGALAYTIIEDLLGFRVDGGFRKPFSLGDLEGAFGSNSSAIGWDATATIGGRLDIGFSYGFRFIFETYKLDFAGATQNVPARGGLCPEELSCTGTDRALTFQFLVGWSI